VAVAGGRAQLAAIGGLIAGHRWSAIWMLPTPQAVPPPRGGCGWRGRREDWPGWSVRKKQLCAKLEVDPGGGATCFPIPSARSRRPSSLMRRGLHRAPVTCSMPIRFCQTAEEAGGCTFDAAGLTDRLRPGDPQGPANIALISKAPGFRWWGCGHRRSQPKRPGHGDGCRCLLIKQRHLPGR